MSDVHRYTSHRACSDLLYKLNLINFISSLHYPSLASFLKNCHLFIEETRSFSHAAFPALKILLLLINDSLVSFINLFCLSATSTTTFLKTGSPKNEKR